MRLIGILVTLLVIAYVSTQYMGKSSNENTDTTQAAESIDQAKHNTEAINEAIKQQQEQLRKQSGQ